MIAGVGYLVMPLLMLIAGVCPLVACVPMLIAGAGRWLVRAYADSRAGSHQGKLSSIGMIGGAGAGVSANAKEKSPCNAKAFWVVGLGGQ